MGSQGHAGHIRTLKDSSWQEALPTRGSLRRVVWSCGAWVWAWVTLMLVAVPANAKYVEGFLKTSEVGTVKHLSSPRPLPDMLQNLFPPSLPAPHPLLLGDLCTNPPPSLQRWTFLARFCFLSHDGAFSFEVEYDIRFATQRLLLYYDAPDQWPAVYGSTKVSDKR